MARIVRSKKAEKKRHRKTSPGPSIVVQTQAGGGVYRDTELYHPPGISTTPTGGMSLIELTADGGIRILVGGHNYRLDVSQDPGEITIFSTDSAGQKIGAKITLKSGGNIEISGSKITWTGEGMDIFGSSDQLVRYSGLKASLDAYATSLGAYLTTLSAAVITAGGPGVTPSPSLFSVNIEQAKTSKINIGI